MRWDSLSMIEPCPTLLRRVATPATKAFAAIAGLTLAASAHAQSKIASLPGYETWAKASEASKGYVSGAVSPVWAPDGKSFTYAFNGNEWRYGLARRKATPIGATQSAEAAHAPAGGAQASQAPVFARGRGAEANVLSPNGKMRALTHDMNLFIAPVEPNAQETQITFDGGAEARIRNGVGSYVYIALKQPKLLILTGKAAANTVLKREEAVSRLRGRRMLYTREGLELPVNAMVMLHPAYLLRQPQQKRQAWADLLLAEAWLEELGVARASHP